jgi:DNA (cytosine-5)-methyltransferase 1
MIRFIELFAGIGGFRYGLERLNGTPNSEGEIYPQTNDETGQGLESPSWKGTGTENRQHEQRIDSNTNGRTFVSVYANEWDKYAGGIYRKHYGSIDSRDITTVGEDEIPDHDLLTAGFPCQAFSIAGRREGFDDTRGTLFFDIARILQQKQPSLCILENVRGLLSHDKGATFDTIIRTLDDLGYDLQWQVLNSKNFGVPQNRERIFIVGHLRGEPRPEVFPFTRESEQSCEIFGRIKDIKGHDYLKRVYSDTGLSPTVSTYGGGNQEAKIAQGVAITHGKLSIKEISTALDANYFKGLDNHQQRVGIMENTTIRRLTPLECERLQGFPDGWTEGMSDTQRYKMLGNAVTTNVITAIGEKL